nr:hypothetical protein CFP56_27547 [Quercus suber]
MDIGKQRALIRKSAVARKQYREGVGSTSKVVPKVALKRKDNAKDDRLPKKGMGPSVGGSVAEIPSACTPWGVSANEGPRGQIHGERGGVFHRLHEHQEIEKKERAQYSEAVHTLNKELTAKTAALAEETRQHEEAKMVKTYLATKLASLREQMEKAKADATAEFRVSQPFFDSCGVYYGVEFNDCLKHVAATYPNLDLSQITIDNTTLPTLGGVDNVSKETSDSIHICLAKSEGHRC